jgi:hypothetical protein
MQFQRCADTHMHVYISTLTHTCKGVHGGGIEAEAAAADVFARITDSRAALTDTFANFGQEIKANSKTEDN